VSPHLDSARLASARFDSPPAGAKSASALLSQASHSSVAGAREATGNEALDRGSDTPDPTDSAVGSAPGNSVAASLGIFPSKTPKQRSRSSGTLVMASCAWRGEGGRPIWQGLLSANKRGGAPRLHAIFPSKSRLRCLPTDLVLPSADNDFGRLVGAAEVAAVHGVHRHVQQALRSCLGLGMMIEKRNGGREEEGSCMAMATRGRSKNPRQFRK